MLAVSGHPQELDAGSRALLATAREKGLDSMLKSSPHTTAMSSELEHCALPNWPQPLPALRALV